MKTAVIYARCASTTANSPNTQIAVCRDYAEKHGYTVVGVYTDSGSGLSLKGREGFTAMNKDKRWQTVIVLRLDRLGRERKAVCAYLNKLRSKGKRVVSCIEGEIIDSYIDLLTVIEKSL